MGMSTGKYIQGGREGMYIISHKGNMCYMAWENSIMVPCNQGFWIKSNGDLGGK